MGLRPVARDIRGDVLVFAGFRLHIAQDCAFDLRTVLVMTLRSAIWGVIALVARQTLSGR